MVSADNREVFSNSSVKPTDRQLTGAINIELPNNRLGLNIVAYRGGGAWLPFLPAALIIALTVIASVTLVQLRRHARRRAATEEELRAGIEAARRGRGRPAGTGSMEQVAIRIDRDVLAAFRAGGAGWQTRMNDALREWLKEHSAV